MSTPNVVRAAINSCPDPELRASALTEYEYTLRVCGEATTKAIRLENELAAAGSRRKTADEEAVERGRNAAQAALPELRRQAGVINEALAAAERLAGK